MKPIKKLESIVAGWYSPAPHFPAKIRRWLGDNAWWLTIVSVALGTLNILNILRGLNTATQLKTLAEQQAPYSPYAEYILHSTGASLLNAWIWLTFVVAMVLIQAGAIKPLKTRQKRGWDLLFIGALVGIASGVIGVLFSLQLAHLLFVITSTIIGLYVLFEIRSEFIHPQK